MNGMSRQRTGSIVNRKGVLFARVTYIDQFGQRQEITRKALDRADAQRIIAELHERIDRHGGEAVANGRLPIADVIERYRQEKAGPAVVQGGKKVAGMKSSYNFGKMLDILKEHFGQTRLCELKSADLHAFKRKRLATKTRHGTSRSIAAVNRELEALRSVCSWSVKQGWISKSPFELGEAVINKNHEVSRDRVLTHDEEERLLAVCTGQRAHLRSIVVMAVDTACRRGEIYKLRWAMVNLAQGVISLPGEITKTGKPRSVPITLRLRDEIVALKEKGSIDDDAFVFPVRVNAKDSWASACKQAQITGLRFHDLRHTAITRMIAAGVNPALVMKISGHDNYQTFLRYLNPQANTLREVADKLHDRNIAEWGRELNDDDYIN